MLTRQPYTRSPGKPTSCRKFYKPMYRLSVVRGVRCSPTSSSVRFIGSTNGSAGLGHRSARRMWASSSTSTCTIAYRQAYMMSWTRPAGRPGLLVSHGGEAFPEPGRRAAGRRCDDRPRRPTFISRLPQEGDPHSLRQTQEVDGRAGRGSGIDPGDRLNRELAVEGLQLFEVPAILGTSRETLEADDATEARDTSRL